MLTKEWGWLLQESLLTLIRNLMWRVSADKERGIQARNSSSVLRGPGWDVTYDLKKKLQVCPSHLVSVLSQAVSWWVPPHWNADLKPAPYVGLLHSLEWLKVQKWNATVRKLLNPLGQCPQDPIMLQYSRSLLLPPLLLLWTPSLAEGPQGTHAHSLLEFLQTSGWLNVFAKELGRQSPGQLCQGKELDFSVLVSCDLGEAAHQACDSCVTLPDLDLSGPHRANRKRGTTWWPRCVTNGQRARDREEGAHEAFIGA